MNELQRDDTPCRDAAVYIADLSHQLAQLAKNHRLSLLHYLLEMARDEARALAAVARETAGSEE